MDYIKNIKTKIYRDINILLKDNNLQISYSFKIWPKQITELNYKFGDCFIFGSESKGIPENIIKKFKDSEKIFIPMTANSRSLNISNAVAVVIYEGLRQNNFHFL